MHTVSSVDFTVRFNNDLINAEISVGLLVLLNNSERATVVYRLFHPSESFFEVQGLGNIWIYTSLPHTSSWHSA
jgi:hypothetical protein